MIENFVSKRLLIILFIGILLFASYYLAKTFFFNLNSIYNVHNHFKEFLYLLANTPKYSHHFLNENLLRKLVSKYHLKIKSLTKLQNSYILEIERINHTKFIRFLATLEKYGIIKSFEAVDNTGKGEFYLKIEVSPRTF